MCMGGERAGWNVEELVLEACGRLYKWRHLVFQLVST